MRSARARRERPSQRPGDRSVAVGVAATRALVTLGNGPQSDTCRHVSPHAACRSERRELPARCRTVPPGAEPAPRARDAKQGTKSKSSHRRKMAAAPIPVNVFYPAGPANPKSPLLVDAADDIVVQLPFLPWKAAPPHGGIACVSIDQSEALVAFCVRCKLDRSPAAIAAMAAINPLTLRLTAAAWSTVLTAVRGGGLAPGRFRILEHLHEHIRSNVAIVLLGTVH